MATKSKTDKNTDNTAIPLAVRPDPAPAKPTGASLLAGLASKAKTAPKKEAKKERPVLPLDSDVADIYAQFAPAKQLFDILDSRVEALKADLNPELFKAWVRIYWKNKSVPANPAIEVEVDGKLDCEGMYIVAERMKVQIPNNEDPAGSVTELLVSSGLERADAERLVENEVDFTPQLSLRPFNELVSGHYESKQFVEASAAEQSVGQKLLEFVQNNLTPEEQELVLLNVPKTVVKKGFLTRAVSYVHSEEQLAKVFKVFSPVPSNKGAKFGVSDTPPVRIERLLDYANELLGLAPESEEDDE